MENINQELPVDMQRQILSWLPPKSLLKFMCVSKNWASIMQEKDFEDLYYERSETRPRMLFAFSRETHDPTPEIVFHSFDQEKELFLSSCQQHMRFPISLRHKIFAPIRGLICLQSETKVVIYNPGTRKFRTLPEIEESSKTYLHESFLGYDKVKKVHKVLYIAFIEKSDVSEIQKAFTMGLDEESWRPVVCKHDHLPMTDGVWNGDVLYYGAFSSGSDNSIVMSFNIRSEELTVIDFPTRARFGIKSKFFNYNETIAFVENSVIENGVINMLVRNEISGEWLKECIEINVGWREIFVNKSFVFKGFIGTEELVLEPKEWLNDGSHFVVYYNKSTGKFSDVFNVDGNVRGTYHIVRTFLNHAHSLSLP